MAGHYEERIDPNSPIDPLTSFPSGTMKVWVEDPAPAPTSTAAPASNGPATVSSPAAPAAPIQPVQNIVNMTTPQGTIASVDINSDAYKQNLGGQFTGYKLATVSAPAATTEAAKLLSEQNKNTQEAAAAQGGAATGVDVTDKGTTVYNYNQPGNADQPTTTEDGKVAAAVIPQGQNATSQNSQLPADNALSFAAGLTDVQKDQIISLKNNKPLAQWTDQDYANFKTATGIDARSMAGGGGVNGAAIGNQGAAGTAGGVVGGTPEAMAYATKQGKNWNTMSEKEKSDAQYAVDLKARVDTTNNAAIANKEFIMGAIKAYTGKDATQSEILQYTGKTVAQVKSYAKQQGGVTEDFDGDTFGENNVANLDNITKNVFLSSLSTNNASSDEFTKFLKDMSNGFVTPDEYVSYLKSGGKISYSDFSKKLEEAGITQLEKDLFSLPDKDYETLYSTKYKELNLGSYKTQIRDLEAERDAKIASMSTNPFLTAAGRNGEVAAIEKQYNGKIDSIQGKYDDGLAEVEGYMERNDKYYNLKKEVYGAKLTYLKDKTEEEIGYEESDRTKSLMAKMLPEYYKNRETYTTDQAEAAIKKDLLKTGEYYVAPNMTEEKAMEMINSGNYLVSKIGNEYLVKPTSQIKATTDYQNWVLMGKPGTFEDYMKTKSTTGGKLTEFQSKAAGFANTAIFANDKVNNDPKLSSYVPSEKDQNAIGQIFSDKSFLGLPIGTPFVNAVAQSKAYNGLSAEGKRFLQASYEFTEPVLRYRTGAAATPSEILGQALIYFPRYGDGVTDVAAKKASRDNVINELKAVSAGGYDQLFGSGSSSGSTGSIPGNSGAEIYDFGW